MVDVSDPRLPATRGGNALEDEALPGVNEELRHELCAVLDDPNTWLTTENPGFGGRTPLQVIAAGGSDLILWKLRAIKHGVFS